MDPQKLSDVSGPAIERLILLVTYLAPQKSSHAMMHLVIMIVSVIMAMVIMMFMMVMVLRL